MLIKSYVIPLDTRTKKNHMMIAGTGPKCPVCGKKAKQFVRQGKAQNEYAFKAAQYLRDKPEEPISCPIRLVYRIYTETHRIVDDLNLFESLDDLLVDNKILEDDNTRIIRNRDGSRVLYDHENPRAEIYIYGEEEED